ncbi:carcinoembryonic antigen-related cell adhesion molecule 1-like [Clarias gariepinus]|uniref:carcinoembryonic antigen-related cell adhesion molecule 1-like n=1 Tax=Clarias gariepinus TaxID=13013 RepID=UPI00234D7558|nr:carcinoembryonic antigen-related cell adhesion molecule 1-like [Clarias gariepinus]
MEQAVVFSLIISFLPGFSQQLNLFPQGAINKVLGTNVYFSTVNVFQPITAIRWEFNGNEMVRYSLLESTIVNPIYDSRLSLKTNLGELQLSRLTLADSGRYTLNITFESGSWSQDHVFLQVFDSVYSLTMTGPQGILIEYSSANFTCSGSGTIITTVWMKETNILYPSNSITFFNDNRTMVINPVKRTDSGIYCCVMSNPISSSFAVSNRITVNYGPDVKILGVDTLNEGSDILLLCSPDSFPPATVIWTVKGMSAGNDSLFVKENSSPSDSGDYNCTCWNNVTGITASAVKAVTVKIASSRLAPGAEAGITLGVICALVILGVSIFFLVRHLKKPAERVRRPISAPQINPAFNHNSGVAQDNFHGQIRSKQNFNTVKNKIFVQGVNC